MAKYGTFKYGTAKYGIGDILYVFDRNLTDVVNDTQKAYLNYFDLNRIETRMQELTNLMNKYGYVNHIITKTNWIKQISSNDLSNFPILSELKRIHDNEQTLMDSLYVYTSTPLLPNNIENLTIYNVNDIEKILYHLHLIIKSIENTFIYCGTVECGEVI